MAHQMEWRPIQNHIGFEISEYGDVRRSDSRKRIKGFIDADGYIRVSLTGDDGKRSAIAIHVLVAKAFIGERPTPSHEVAHENGSRFNCHYSNLRWSLPADNQADKVTHGTSPVGERNPRAKITDADVVDIRMEYRRIKQPGSGRSVSELERRYGLHRATIVGIANGARWPHVPMPDFSQMEI